MLERLNEKGRLSVDVSVIVVSYNTREVTLSCIRSVIEQTRGVVFEIIVIDNASADGSAEAVGKNFSQVTLLQNDRNVGFAAANNQGMAAAKGRYVLLLNSDTVIIDDAISKMVRFADSHTDVAVAGCRVLNPDRSLQQTCFQFPSLLNMMLSCTYLYKVFPRSRFFGRERMTWWGRNDIKEVDVVTGCCMLVRREAIARAGMLDERFFMYAEETDWCYRFKQAGFKVMFTPEAEIVHLHGTSSKQRRAEMVLQLRGSILLFLKKHRNRAVYSAACLLVATFFLLRVPYWLVVGVISSDDRRYGFETALTYLKGIRCAVTGWQGLCVRR